MTNPLFNRVLLTNDDGIGAPGLAVLERVAAQIAREVWVVAPEQDQSGTSHCISLHDPLRISGQGERRFAVFGTPGDCVAIGLRHLMTGHPPDLILSGINRGANLGVETVFSGTVGAAMTGMLLGVPAIALSQAFSDRAQVPWDTALHLAPGIIRQLVGLDWAQGACLNVNFPDRAPDQAQPLKATRQGKGRLDGIDIVTRQDPRQRDYHWLQLTRMAPPDDADTETGALAAGHVTVTPLQFERTQDKVFADLRRQISGV
jgi:5'-nucleotidase